MTGTVYTLYLSEKCVNAPVLYMYAAQSTRPPHAVHGEITCRRRVCERDELILYACDVRGCREQLDLAIKAGLPSHFPLRKRLGCKQRLVH